MQERKGSNPLVVLRGSITLPVKRLLAKAQEKAEESGWKTTSGGTMEKIPMSEGQVEDRKGPHKTAKIRGKMQFFHYSLFSDYFTAIKIMLLCSPAHRSVSK